MNTDTKYYCTKAASVFNHKLTHKYVPLYSLETGTSSSLCLYKYKT